MKSMEIMSFLGGGGHQEGIMNRRMKGVMREEGV